MHLRQIYPLALLIASSAFGQLTTEQKVMDFEQTVGIFAKNYGPYEWKKQLIGFDLLNAEPWLTRIRATRTDLEFYDLMSEYVASLDDAHDTFQMPSFFSASLNFSVDIYDGRLLVDSINRSRLPTGEFPFVAGYELVSIDGQDPNVLVERFLRYSRAANPRSTRRNAASLVTFRPQSIIPNAPDVPEIATVIFRRFDGTTETYRIPWTKTGLPFGGDVKLPTPGDSGRAFAQPFAGDFPSSPDYMQPLLRLQNTRISDKAIINFGTVNPVYLRGLPGTFVQRLGRLPSEFFFSGTYPAGGYRIGLIRIPSYAPADQISAVNQFLREVTYMQENTDGLIIDQARNPGGSVAYTQTLLSLLHHYPFRTLGFSVRATSAWIFAYSSARESAIAQGAPPEIIAQFDLILNAMREANRANRGMTTPVPLAGLSLEIQPVRDVRGNLLSFSKPLMVLIDEFSASGGDAFAAVIQDSGRGPLFGYRTMGAGGNVAGYDAGSFSQGFVSVTESLMVRASERAESGPYPVSPYVENVGVRPDIEYDIMTRQNLLQNFRPYVSAFSEAMVNWIQSVNRGAAQ